MSEIASRATITAPIQPVGLAERSRRFRATERGQAAAVLKQARDYFSRPFIGWDGEGVTTDDGVHRYVLLSNSLGDTLVNPDGIPSAQAFDMLLSTSKAKAIHVAYGAGYDINMMLSDWSYESLRLLYTRKRLKRGEFSLAWRPGKSLHIQRGRESLTLFDCMPFFQTTFDNACAQYLGEDYPDRAMIRANKALRSDFTLADMETVLEYNRAELRNLVTLMEELRRRLDAVGLRPSRWDGPGAVAAALFKREGVKHALSPTRTEDSPQSRASRYAYAGGRFEIIRWGSVADRAFEYDLNSAYPSALRDVPCLAHGKWIHVQSDHVSRPESFAVYHVRYSAGRKVVSHRPAPLFRRESNGTICYPPHVTGWYWAPEVFAAREYVERFGGSLDVLESFVWQPNSCSMPRPFAFVEPMFEKRRALKRAGDGAHVGIKLGLNSLYGKTAQQVGWEPPIRKGEPPKIPPFHQLEWAGYTTSHCRAQVLKAAMTDIDSVIAFETDALFTMRPLDLDFGSGLGQWEATEFTRLAYVQSGMYFAETADGKVIERTRGIDRGTVHLDDVLTALGNPRAIDRRISAPLTRFIGAGLALSQDFDKWRTWDRTHKDVWACPAPGGKRAHDGCRYCGPPSAKGVRIDVWHETYVPFVNDAHSCEYPIGWINPNPAMNQLEELRELAYERGDSL